MSRIFTTAVALFVCCCIFLIPFPYHLFPYTGLLCGFLFNDLLLFFAEHVFMLRGALPQISSDSVLMYLLFLTLFIGAAGVAVFIGFKAGQQSRWGSFYATSRIMACYYLALHLMKYGVDKLFKTQFYLPEPNILYMPFGQLDQDILYWSTMGTSPAYQVFLGASEVIASLLLLFRKTRVLGFLAALVLMMNIVAVNFSFNISVKLFSLFLLFLAVWLLAPYFKTLYRFLVLQEVAGISPVSSAPVLNHPFWKTTIKTAAILLLMSESVYPHLWRIYLDGATPATPFLNGAYQVVGNDSAGTHPDVKRFFIHRDGYFIFQGYNDQVKDYRLQVDKARQQLILTDYRHRKTTFGYLYHQHDSTLELTLPGDASPTLKARALNWKSLPALQTRFRWAIDGAGMP